MWSVWSGAGGAWIEFGDRRTQPTRLFGSSPGPPDARIAALRIVINLSVRLERVAARGPQGAALTGCNRSHFSDSTL